MYTISSAAIILGVTESTLKNWIKRANIQKITLTTDRTRVYIRRNDMLALMAEHYHDLNKLAEIPENPKSPHQDLYTIQEIASILDISTSAVKKWLGRSDIERKVIVTDRKRTYISYQDMRLLVYNNRYKVKTEKKAPEGLVIDDEGNCYQIEPGEKELYTLEEAAKSLNVSTGTIQRWIEQSGVGKKVILTDRLRGYVQASDIELLAKQRHRGKVDPDLYTLKEAASMLGIAVDTLDRWIKRSGIVKKTMPTKKSRVYIQHSDIKLLGEQHQRLLGEQYQQRPDEEGFYTLKEIASFMNVKARTVRVWVERFDLPKKIVIADRSRIYVQYSALLKHVTPVPKPPSY